MIVRKRRQGQTLSTLQQWLLEILCDAAFYFFCARGLLYVKNPNFTLTTELSVAGYVSAADKKKVLSQMPPFFLKDYSLAFLAVLQDWILPSFIRICQLLCETGLKNTENYNWRIRRL